MSRVDVGRGELHCKVVYAGPALGGKTTNLEWLHGRLPATRRGRLVSLSTHGDRTLFFDFLPVEIPDVVGLKLRLSLYTIPGQSIYRVTQALILRDADGIVFVADSHPFRLAANEASLKSLRTALRARGSRLDSTPHVFQYNKRDLPNRLALGRLEARLNPASVPFIPSVATEGKGVGTTLKELTRRMVKQALALEGEGRAPEHG